MPAPLNSLGFSTVVGGSNGTCHGGQINTYSLCLVVNINLKFSHTFPIVIFYIDYARIFAKVRFHLLNRFLNYRDLPLPPARIVQLDDGECATRDAITLLASDLR